MTDLPGNPHVEVLKDYADPRNSLEAVATLALAYEQRTATLAQLLLSHATVTGLDYNQLRQEVLTRLGLEGTK